MVAATAVFALEPGPIPQWIWSSQDHALGAPVELRRRFEVRELPRRASVWVLADDSATLLINGQQVLQATGTRRIREVRRTIRGWTNPSAAWACWGISPGEIPKE